MTVTPPVQIFSFTDYSATHASTPLPGDRVDAQFVEHKRAIDETIAALEVITRSDGQLKNGSVTADTLAPGLAASLAAAASAEIAPDVAAAQSASTAAQAAKTAVDAKAATVDSQAAEIALQHADIMGAAGTALADANNAVSAIALQMAALGNVQTFISNAENDTLAAAATAQEWAEVSVAWAEYMPGPIPPNILAIMGVTGDHWSSKWWSNRANQDAAQVAIDADRAEAAADAAETAQAAAEAAAASAAGSWDDFDDRYLGPKAAAPVTDNDGGPLQTGALYFDTTIGQMLVWDGATWQSFAGSTIASDVAFTPAGSISAINVQDALEEVATDYAAGDAATLASAESYADGLDAAQKTYIDNADAALQAQVTAAQADADAANANANTRVLKAGDTMTGPLVLPGNPATALQAAPKQYVDAGDATANANANTRVLKVGDTMTGTLIVKKAEPDLQLWDTFSAADRRRSRFIATTGWTYLQSLTDAGAFVASGFGFEHQTGLINFEVRPLFNGIMPWDNGNFPMDITTVLPTPGDAPVWDGAKFVPGLSGGAVVSDAPPTFKPGALWWESDTGAMFIGYRDANSDQWVQTNANTGVPEAPLDGIQYARRNGAWEPVGDPGELREFFLPAAPAGWLVADGAAVALATYTRLAAIYCGDANNPTANWGYRCTNPANPTGSRSTTGTHIVLPNAQGEFRRGFDNGRGVDAGRSLWAWQDHMFQTHRHSIGGTSNLASSAGSIAYYRPGSENFASGALDPSTGNFGPETRPRNIAALVCIRY